MRQAILPIDARGEPREEVHRRLRAFDAAGSAHTLLVVNVSASGLMARTDAAFVVGAPLRVSLPRVGELLAEVRWSLGGRIGCQFAATIPLADYYALLAAMRT